MALLPEGRIRPVTLDSAQIGHILLSISAYAALMTAALQSILIGVQERAARTPNRVVGYAAADGEHGKSVYLRTLVRASPTHAVNHNWHVVSARHV